MVLSHLRNSDASSTVISNVTERGFFRLNIFMNMQLNQPDISTALANELSARHICCSCVRVQYKSSNKSINGLRLRYKQLNGPSNQLLRFSMVVINFSLRKKERHSVLLA